MFLIGFYQFHFLLFLFLEVEDFQMVGAPVNGGKKGFSNQIMIFLAQQKLEQKTRHVRFVFFF